MHCDSAKEIWDKLKNVYEGDAKFKGAKLQTYKGQFEHLRMKEDEDIAVYFLQVDEIVNTIRGLGENIENSVIVQNIVISLPMRFDPKISSLEERQDMAMLSMDELHGILTTYEMRIEQENPSKREATFKASKKTRKRNPRSKPCSSNSHDSYNEEEANFVRKMKNRNQKVQR
jgi:hypothetical protein